MGRYRKCLAWAAGVPAAVTLNSYLVVAIEAVTPVVAVSADAQAFTAQRATDIRFRVGIFIRKQ